MQALTIILFLLIITSGSVFSIVFLNRKFEELLPITCSSIVIILYLFGYFEILKYGVTVVCVVSLVLYVLSIVKIIKNKTYTVFIKNLLTPGFLVFNLLVVIFLITMTGKVFDGFDEFSHWGDVVKAMTTIDDFATNHHSRSIFKSYPPAMSLFQYFIEKINTFIIGDIFSEWLCYFSYYIFAVSFLMPVCRKMNFKKWFTPFTMVGLIILVSYTFYIVCFSSIYIDQFLSFLICAGALSLLFDDNDLVSYINIICICFVLTLAKDTGLLFAGFLVVAYMAKRIVNGGFSRKNIILSLVSTLSIIIPKLTWNNCIVRNAVTVMFSEKIDFVDLFNVLAGKTDSYRSEVLDNYIYAIVNRGITVGLTTFKVSYVVMGLLAISLVILLSIHSVKNFDVKKNNAIISSLYICLSLIIFVLGLSVIYMYKFSQTEALYLASFDRYINIVYLGIWLYVMTFALLTANELKSEKIACVVLAVIMIIWCPLKTIYAWGLRRNVQAALDVREPYNELADKLNKVADGNAKVFYVGQGTTGYERLVFKFLIRPNYQKNSVYNLGIETSEDDAYNWQMTAKEWMDLLKEEYDYVAIYCVDDYFEETYVSLFESSDAIKENSVYSIDKAKNMLILCD